MPIEAQGLESTLKALQKIQPEVKIQFFRDAKKIVAPVVDTAKTSYLDKYLSGMFRNWSVPRLTPRRAKNSPSGRTLFPYSQEKAKKGVSVQTSLSKKRDAVLTIIQKDGAASIIDYAGTKTVSSLSRNLTEKAGPTPRVMWRSYDKHAPQVEAEMQKSVNEVMKRITAFEKRVIL